MSVARVQLVDEIEGELQFAEPSDAELAASRAALALDELALTIAVHGERSYRSLNGGPHVWVNAAWHYPKTTWLALEGHRLPEGQLVEVVIDELSRSIPGQFTVFLYAVEDPDYMAVVKEDA